MLRQVEISIFDLHYESYRMQSKRDEIRLLNSILEKGIRDPLEGVDKEDKVILLNGCIDGEISGTEGEKWS